MFYSGPPGFNGTDGEKGRRGKRGKVGPKGDSGILGEGLSGNCSCKCCMVLCTFLKCTIHWA